MLILIISSGPDKGRLYELLDDTPVILGREGDQVKLDDRKASRQHAKLWAQGGQWFIQDLDSRHGTYHNSRSIGGSPVKIQDGDRIRIGDTRFVVARMPVEQVERAKLLGNASTEKEARRAVAAPGGRMARVGGVAIAAALAAAIGLNVYSLIQSNSNTQQLRDQIAAAERSREAKDLEPMLRDILAAVGDQPDRDAILAAVRTALADQPDHQKTLDTILAKVDAQANQWLAVADLRDAMGRQQAVAAETRDTLAQVLTKLNEAPQAQDTTELRTQLAQVLEKLDQNKAPAADEQTLAKLDAVLAKLDAQQPAASPAVDPAIRESLAAVLEKLNAPAPAAPAIDTDALAKQIAAEVRTASDADRQVLQRIALEVGAQRDLAAQVAELRELVAAQPQATRAVLDEALADLARQRDTADVLAAVERVRSALPGDASDKLDMVLSRLDAKASPQLIADAVESVLAKQTQTQQASLDAMRAELQAIADTQRTTPEAIINEVRSVVASRNDADARLAELVEFAAAQPRSNDKVEALLQQVLVELRARPSDSASEDEVLVGVLRELRNKAIASMDELRQTIRTELDARLVAPTAAAPTAVAAATRPSPTIMGETTTTPRVPMTSALLGEREIAGDAISGATSGGGGGGGAASGGLSRTEQAYKLAFETGQPITIGAGQVNPMTGQMSEGRTLDPAAAKAAGIKSWREWFLMDDFAERMRLQQQASRFRQDNPSNPDLIKLPPQNRANP